MSNVNLILYSAFIILGLFFIVLAVLRSQKAKKAAETWPTAAGVVLTCEVSIHRSHSSRGHSSVSYRPDVTYEYRVDGQKYSGDGIGFGTATYGKKKADSIAAVYPQGTNVTVHYDPKDPSKAVLETKSVGGGNLIVLGIIMIGVGLLGFFILPH
jgi:hypothetical protein